jgi:hypothetical protein
MLALLLRAEGVNVEAASAHVLPSEILTKVEEAHAATVFIAMLPPGGVPQAAYLCRLLRRRFPALKIVVAWWGYPRHFDELVVYLRRSGADYVTSSLREARGQVLFAAALPPADRQPPRLSARRRRSRN